MTIIIRWTNVSMTFASYKKHVYKKEHMFKNHYNIQDRICDTIQSIARNTEGIHHKKYRRYRHHKKYSRPISEFTVITTVFLKSEAKKSTLWH